MNIKNDLAETLSKNNQVKESELKGAKSTVKELGNDINVVKNDLDDLKKL